MLRLDIVIWSTYILNKLIILIGFDVLKKLWHYKVKRAKHFILQIDKENKMLNICASYNADIYLNLV